MAEDRYMTTKEVLAELQLSERTLYNYRARGLLKWYRLGGRFGMIRYRRSELIQALEATYCEEGAPRHNPMHS